MPSIRISDPMRVLFEVVDDLPVLPGFVLGTYFALEESTGPIPVIVFSVTPRCPFRVRRYNHRRV